MYMVDNKDHKENCFGYTNKDGDIEYVKYDKSNGNGYCRIGW